MLVSSFLFDVIIMLFLLSTQGGICFTTNIKLLTVEANNQCRKKDTYTNVFFFY